MRKILAFAIVAVLAGCDAGHDHSGLFEVVDYNSDGRPIARYIVGAEDLGQFGACDLAPWSVRVNGQFVELSRYASVRRFNPPAARLPAGSTGRTE